MKAIVAASYGSPDVLRLADVAKPAPQPNEVLVKVFASTVNVGDSRMRSFNVPPLLWLPARLTLGLRAPKQPIYGMELAGTVEAVGSAVTRFQPGDAVYASTLEAGFGAHAEYKCLREDAAMARKPQNTSWEQAAALPISANTALYFLRQANIQPGQTVLVNGASGGVGSYAVQVAKHFGAEVTGVCSTGNLEMVKGLGAAHVIDYTRTDFTQSGAAYDVIFDAAGKTTFAQAQHALKPGGVYLSTVLALSGLKAPWYARRTGLRVIGGTAPARAAVLDDLRALVEAGHLKPVIDRCYPLEETADAHRYVDQGHKRGAVVIRVAR